MVGMCKLGIEGGNKSYVGSISTLISKSIENKDVGNQQDTIKGRYMF